MGPVLVTAIVALVAGLIVAAIVHRWPHTPLVAPRVAPDTVAKEVHGHWTVASFFRSRLDPATETGLLLTVAAIVVVVGAGAVGALLVMVRRSVGFARWDLRFADWGARNASEMGSEVLRTVSLLGGTSGLIVVGLIVAIVESRRIPHRSPILFLLLVLVGQNLLANGAKMVVDRARPDISRLTGFAGSSFPSGHSTAAAATYAAVALLMSRGRGRQARALIAGGGAAIAAAVAASRVFLGVHWFTDVLAGLALGWAWFALCSIAVGGRVMVFAVPAAVADQEAVAPGAVTPAAAEQEAVATARQDVVGKVAK